MNADAPNCFNFIFTESDIQTVTPKTNISPSQKYRNKPRAAAAAAAAVTMETDSESELIYRHKSQVLLASSQMVYLATMVKPQKNSNFVQNFL